MYRCNVSFAHGFVGESKRPVAELKNRKMKSHEQLADLGLNIARLVKMAHPQATKEAIGVNALIDSLPGPVMESMGTTHHIATSHSLCHGN